MGGGGLRRTKVSRSLQPVSLSFHAPKVNFTLKYSVTILTVTVTVISDKKTSIQMSCNCYSSQWKITKNILCIIKVKLCS